MKFNLFKTEIYISFGFAFILAFLLSIDKIGIASIFFISVLAHEIGHLVIFLLFRLNVDKIDFTAFGISIIPKNIMLLGYKRELLCYLGGPIMNFAIAYFVQRLFLPTFQCRMWIAVNIVLAIFNLIPMLPLDGGRIFSTILHMFFSDKAAEKISEVFAAFFFLVLCLFSLYVYKKNHNPAAIISCVFLLLQNAKNYARR